MIGRSIFSPIGIAWWQSILKFPYMEQSAVEQLDLETEILSGPCGILTEILSGPCGILTDILSGPCGILILRHISSSTLALPFILALVLISDLVGYCSASASLFTYG